MCEIVGELEIVAPARLAPRLSPASSAALLDSRWAGNRRISHAIPSTQYRATHVHRWNCNVCRCCWKFTQSNCMRNCSERAYPRARGPSNPHVGPL